MILIVVIFTYICIIKSENNFITLLFKDGTLQVY